MLEGSNLKSNIHQSILSALWRSRANVPLLSPAITQIIFLNFTVNKKNKNTSHGIKGIIINYKA